MHKKFENNQTKIKGGCRSGGKVVSHNSKSDLPLVRAVAYNVAKDESCIKSNPALYSWLKDIAIIL